MKILLLHITLFYLSFFHANGQFKTLAEGPVFEEPQAGSVKILQLKNGNTAFLHIINEKINVQIYNQSHQKTAEQSISTTVTKKDFNPKAIFEINNDIVLIGTLYKGKDPMLYRWLIDENSGSLKEEQKIDNIDWERPTILFGGGAPGASFQIRKDPESDYYAVIAINGSETDRNKRLELSWYGPDNKLIRKTYLPSPKDRYKFLEYLDMVVLNNKRVSVLISAYNTQSSGGKERAFVLANLSSTDSTVSEAVLPFAKDLVVNDAITRYNPITKKIIVVTAAKANQLTDEYTCYLACIEPETKHVDYSGIIYPVKANEKKMELFGEKHRFTGLPQNLYINNDGTFSVVYEEITQISSTHLTNTELGNIAISKYNATGKELSSCFIPKSQLLRSYSVSPFYLYYGEGSFTSLYLGNQYRFFSYLNGGEKSYILFNDIEENAEKAKKGKLTTIQSVKDCDGYYYNISGFQTLPERNYFFDKPDNKQNNLALFDVSDYNKQTNTYVTLKLEQVGKDKGVKLVWLQPQ
ncbi:MAG: hypothetical protein ABUT20_14685 [Bacteroidota bacterium]